MNVCKRRSVTEIKINMRSCIKYLKLFRLSFALKTERRKIVTTRLSLSNVHEEVRVEYTDVIIIFFWVLLTWLYPVVTSRSPEIINYSKNMPLQLK
jgi:hypothetical protein